MYKVERKRLRVDEFGEYYYKKTSSSTLMASLQLGLKHSIGVKSKLDRDILMTDFERIESIEFPAIGNSKTPAHKYKDFTFRTYSPEAFRFIREAFDIHRDDYVHAICDQPLSELSNPGASGSLFYRSYDDVFIMKTVKKKEARFLQKLLPGYYLNMTQNKQTLLPKFFGLYTYRCGRINIRIVVMNNLLPSGVVYHEKFDLKGSTYKRKADSEELTKENPTYKDLDFIEKHGKGVMVSPDHYATLLHCIEKDCKVLESFGIMDYSLLLGVHNIDQAIREQDSSWIDTGLIATSLVPVPSHIKASKKFFMVSAEDIPSRGTHQQHYPQGYIPGYIHGDRVICYLGIIDVLQNYNLTKKLEHGIKTMIADRSTLSVQNPIFYARRFQDFMAKEVFQEDHVDRKTSDKPGIAKTPVTITTTKPKDAMKSAALTVIEDKSSTPYYASLSNSQCYHSSFSHNIGLPWSTARNLECGSSDVCLKNVLPNTAQAPAEGSSEIKIYDEEDKVDINHVTKLSDAAIVDKRGSQQNGCFNFCEILKTQKQVQGSNILTNQIPSHSSQRQMIRDYASLCETNSNESKTEETTESRDSEDFIFK